MWRFFFFFWRTDVEAETPNTLATWSEELTYLKRPWCRERMKSREGDDRGWDGWMAPLTQWTVSLSQLQELVMDKEAWHASVHGSQRVRHDWVTELNWTDVSLKFHVIKKASPFMDSVSNIRGKLRAAHAPPLQGDNPLFPHPWTLSNLKCSCHRCCLWLLQWASTGRNNKRWCQ